MKKQKILLICSIVMLSVVEVCITILFAVKVLNLALFLIFGLIILAMIVASVIMLVLVKKKIKTKVEQKKTVENKTTGNYLEDLYNILGIPIQYNPDGSIKDIYDLLQIEPQYDEDGNLILTPYELLGIMPQFTQDGVEIPSFFVIKNRVGKIAKVDLTHRVLKRKLTDQEKEELLIRETLLKQLEEAEKKKEKEKQEALKKVIANLNNKPKPKAPKKDTKKKKTPKVITPSAKVIKFGNYTKKPKIKETTIKADLSDVEKEKNRVNELLEFGKRYVKKPVKRYLVHGGPKNEQKTHTANEIEPGM